MRRVDNKAVLVTLLYWARVPSVQKGGPGTCWEGEQDVLPYWKNWSSVLIFVPPAVRAPLYASCCPSPPVCPPPLQRCQLLSSPAGSCCRHTGGSVSGWTGGALSGRLYRAPWFLTAALHVRLHANSCRACHWFVKVSGCSRSQAPGCTRHWIMLNWIVYSSRWMWIRL